MNAEALIAQFGVAGVIIAGLLWDRFRILKDNQELQKEVRNLYQDNADTLKALVGPLKALAAREKGSD